MVPKFVHKNHLFTLKKSNTLPLKPPIKRLQDIFSTIQQRVKFHAISGFKTYSVYCKKEAKSNRSMTKTRFSSEVNIVELICSFQLCCISFTLKDPNGEHSKRDSLLRVLCSNCSLLYLLLRITNKNNNTVGNTVQSV